MLFFLLFKLSLCPVKKSWKRPLYLFTIINWLICYYIFTFYRGKCLSQESHETLTLEHNLDESKIM